MSLQELGSSPLHLVLGIKEGHGFGFLQNPVVIVAGTCGSTLETEVVPPSPDPIFRTDLAWETDKKSLRRFRTSNTPIKLECFTVNNTKKRDCIGYILLNIKCAQVIPSNTQPKVIEHWHRLIGVPPEAKALQPELLLSLTIQDSRPTMVPLPSASSAWPRGSATGVSQSNIPTPRSARAPPSSQELVTNAEPLTTNTAHTVPILSEEEGHIQLGPDTSCTDVFLLYICVGHAGHLEQLVSGANLQTQIHEEKSLKIVYNIFNHRVGTKAFGLASGSETSVDINESVVLRLRTSLSHLHMYLQEHPSITMCLLLHEKEIGASELHMRNLVPTDDILCFCREFNAESSCSQHCLLVSSYTGNIPSAQDGVQPYVEVSVKLQLLSLPANQKKEKVLAADSVRKPSEHSGSSYPVFHTSGGGDQPSSRSDSRQSQDTFIMPENGPKWVPVVLQTTAPSQPAPAQTPKDTPDKTTVTYKPNVDSMVHNFSVQIKLSSVVFDRLPTSSRIRFLFECFNTPMLTSALTDAVVVQTGVPVPLAGISGSITVQTSTKNLELELSQTNTVQITAVEVGSDPASTRLFACAQMCIQSLDLPNKRECCVSAILEANNESIQVGRLYATVFLVDHGVHQSPVHVVEIRPKSTVVTEQVQGLPPVQSVASSSTAVLQHHLQPTLPTSSQPVGADRIQSTAPPGPPPSLDSPTAYQIVEELEDWKERQQELFRAELKRKEAEHLARLSEEASARKNEMELDLDRNMAHCKALVQSLTKANEDLKERNKNSDQRKFELEKAKVELEQQYNLKFQELTLAARRLDEGVKLKVSLAEMKCSQLEERIASLEAENESLRQQLRQKPSSHKTSPTNEQRCGLTHNQTTKLLGQVKQLEEKLDSTLQSKAYFKEQWGRAVREMNLARAQFGKPSDKLEDILGKEKVELQSDRKALEELQQELASHIESNRQW